ncbi:MAG TPA: cupredoxin family copper-binding protein [Nocardioides sp.]|nr:cupredoxin family copper-binding protein [Nocardioides sp.]
MRIRTLLLALALTLSGLLSVLPAAAPPAQAATPVQVAIRNMAFSPSWVKIHRGRTVRWTNHDPMAHDIVVTSGPRIFRSPLLQPGQSFSHTFRVRGTYRYKCGIHPTMRGTVKVV